MSDGFSETQLSESCLDIKTHTMGFCVSTVALGVPHHWGRYTGKPEYWFETYIFPSDGKDITEWLERWGQRYKTEDEARDGHDEVVARVERGDLPGD